jgi:hypothetical protein
MRQGDIWKLQVLYSEHSDDDGKVHEASVDPSVHRCHRTLTAAQQEVIRNLSKSKLTAQQILDSLYKSFPGIAIKPQDIWNERYRQRVE